jgi:pyridoxamine 5'-phosphate oxidase
MVLLKGYDERGFVFYTNLGSKKAREIGENPRASLGFHWKTLKRQVRVSGHVLPVSAEEADAYFASRSRGSQIGAWASRQSQDLPSRKALELAVANAHDRFSTGVVPRPSFWSGFRVAPLTIEFWEELPFRLHRRDEYSRTEQGWSKRSLFP